MDDLKSGRKVWDKKLSKAAFDAQGLLKDWIAGLRTDSKYQVEVGHVIAAFSQGEQASAKSEKGQDFGGFGFFDDEDSPATESLPEATVSPSHPTPGTAEVKAEAAGSHAKHKVAAKTIRVEQSKLDGLLVACSELTLMQSIIVYSHLTKSYQQESFNNAVQQSSKILRNLRDQAFSMRMQPLTQLFQKMTRVARDVASDLNKEIQFRTEGEDVELDKSIVEQLQDPLVHMVRNSIDHGVEADRKAAGKSPLGNVTLNAVNFGSHVTITLSDDGQGMDHEALRSKGIAMGLISEKSKLTELELFNLIFLPGFSTAKNVTAISGRGVGLDVVKNTVAACNGEIKLWSEHGKGSTFTLTLPTSIGIMDALVIGLDHRKYAVPLNEVLNVLDLNQFAITHETEERQMFRFKDEIIPVRRMDDYLKAQVGEPLENDLALLSDAGSFKMALTFEKIYGIQEIVISNLPESMHGYKGISGMTILNDGEPTMVLSPRQICSEYLKASNVNELGAVS